MKNRYKFSVLLSAGVPKEKRSKKYHTTFSKIRNAQLQIDEAVNCLTRSILKNGGRLVFGGQQSISPLVAMVASETNYKNVSDFGQRLPDGEKPITIFQSEAFASVIPRETTNMAIQGNADIVWFRAVNGEMYDPELEDRIQCSDSLDAMRRGMIDQPLDAMVCIGGMEGVEDEFELFRKIHPFKKVYLLHTTGGATSILADLHSKNEFIKVPDSDFVNKIKIPDGETDIQNEIMLIPYNYYSEMIVREIIGQAK